MSVPQPRPRPLGRCPARFHQSLPGSPGSPLLARGLLREALRRHPEETVRTAQLMLTELVTNVLMHARTTVELEIEVAVTSIRVTVSDTSPELPRPARSGGKGGLGLMIVDSLSTTWGWNRTPSGKRVWFELEGQTMPTPRPAWLR